MRELVFGDAVSRPPVISEARLMALARTPLDQLQRWLREHAHCALAGPSTVTLDPPRWRYGAAVGLRGRCERCGTAADLTTDLAASTPVNWWLQLMLWLLLDNCEAWWPKDGVASADYVRCWEVMDTVVRHCVLLDDLRQADIAHH